MRHAVVALVALVALAAPAGAAAAGDLEVGIADDAAILHEPDERRATAVALRWKALGIERVRLFAEWYKVVPGNLDVTRPEGFDPADPDDPQYGWAKLDRAVRIVRAAGLRPMLTVTGPAPVWATEEPARRNPRWRPDPAQFGVFAEVVARRFGPVVDRYVIWNEPNVPLWLQPQATCRGRRCTPFSPFQYRRLVRAAQPAIERADPGAEVLVGALAPRGSRLASRNAQMKPLQFLRALGCVTRAYARDRSGPCRGFAPLRADAFAHHPHSILLAPDVPSGKPDDVNMAELSLLAAALDRIQARGGLVRPGGGRFPLHLTEWGYQTDPPDRLLGVTYAKHAAWLQQGAFLAWRHPRVRSLVQYLWRDEPLGRTGDVLADAAGWQSGLITEDGDPKPALARFALPFWAEPRAGGAALLWGQVRTRDVARVLVQVRRGGTWRRAGAATPNRFGYWTLRRRMTARSEELRVVAGERRSGVQRVRALTRRASARG